MLLKRNSIVCQHQVDVLLHCCDVAVVCVCIVQTELNNHFIFHHKKREIYNLCNKTTKMADNSTMMNEDDAHIFAELNELCDDE